MTLKGSRNFTGNFGNKTVSHFLLAYINIYYKLSGAFNIIFIFSLFKYLLSSFALLLYMLMDQLHIYCTCTYLY